MAHKYRANGFGESSVMSHVLIGSIHDHVHFFFREVTLYYANHLTSLEGLAGPFYTLGLGVCFGFRDQRQII